MLTLLLVFITISLLILAHEWGHFYSARVLGVRVEEFGFGFPPKIYSRVKNGIKYSFNLLPLGGFVKIFGEHGEGEGDRESFISRPAWQRFIILSAGVFMNLVLAWAFFSFGSLAGVPEVTDSKDEPVAIVGVLPKTPAEQAGLKFGDKILELRAAGLPVLRVETEKNVRDFVDARKGETITLFIRRGDKNLEIQAIPRGDFPEGEGPLGIALARMTVKKVPWFWAPVEGAKTLFRALELTVMGLASIIKELVFEGRGAAAVSGPVGIFTMIGDSRSMGLAYLLQFIGLLSVNLAILNFLPIPALDGGRVLFLAIEKIRRKKIDPKWENSAHAVGFAILLLLMVLVTFKDITRIF